MAPPDVEGLDGHECLIFSSRTQRQAWRFRGQDGEPVKSRGRGRLRLDSGEAIRDAAVAGLGIALLPEFLVADDLATGRLRQVLADVRTDHVRIAALYPSKRLLEPRVRRFIDLLNDELER